MFTRTNFVCTPYVVVKLNDGHFRHKVFIALLASRDVTLYNITDIRLRHQRQVLRDSRLEYNSTMIQFQIQLVFQSYLSHCSFNSHLLSNPSEHLFHLLK